MKLGILEAGCPPDTLARFGGYPEMFRKLLGENAFDYVVFDIQSGELPSAADACPAYLVTGSASGVYEALPWIARLEDFLRAVKGRAALVGICFGHQVMAQAFGGKVVQSPKGWGVGAHTYRLAHPQPWFSGPAEFTLPASHQDQVVVAPPNADVAGGSDFAPFGLLAYRDQPAISLQLHPEFDEDYAVALTESKRDHGLSDAAIDEAVSSLHRPNDRERAAAWIRQFVEQAAPLA